MISAGLLILVDFTTLSDLAFKKCSRRAVVQSENTLTLLLPMHMFMIFILIYYVGPKIFLTKIFSYFFVGTTWK
ncbi:hypothetical protein CIPAW_07G099800 [Carya illinoinensis]|uniref:Uncharacterized protein n=1 Tax=Carya illinoinensis TaxID=32201 RepID=A0A8T1PT81_CARIL|nr:hypothetical protein CIPAW_07G099800 [Carya illinoinensis]